MRSLTKVTGPSGVHGLAVRQVPSLLLWVEGDPDSEVLSTMRSFLAGRLALYPYKVDNSNTLANSGWGIARLVRIKLLGRSVIVSELSKADGDLDAASWWETTLLPALRQKFTVGQIETLEENEQSVPAE